MRRVCMWLLCISSANALLCIEDPGSINNNIDKEGPLVSIDTSTLDEPQGNWLFKRHWWKRANKIYDHITTLVNEIFDLRSQFTNERVGLDRNLFDPFYLRVGIKQGELRALISYLIEQLERDSDAQEDSEKERILLGKLKDHKGVVVQINADIKDIGIVDQEVDNAITTLLEQLNLVRSYKQQAWEAFKAIERELSDQRARELVFEMRAFQKNIKDIKDYLLGSFTEYFNSLVSRAQEEVERIELLIGELREKGIDLKQEAHDLEFIEGDVRDTEMVAPKGFFASIWSFIRGLFS